jgi:hypothetical protein
MGEWRIEIAYFKKRVSDRNEVLKVLTLGIVEFTVETEGSV